jgi:4-hydroxy-2-oxoheptanedioate aldolase
MLAYKGWDFIVFDAEHGTIEPRDCENMVRAVELHGVTPIVRVTTNAPSVILRYMDTGAHGLHVPWVNSADEAEAAVRSVKYYPRGIRGLAGVRAADYAQRNSLGQYIEEANAETMIVMQVETARAVEQLTDIIAIGDIDVVFIGPSDLTHSLGVPGQLQHPMAQEALSRIVSSVAGTDIALGIMVNNLAAAKEWRQRGARYITIGLESLIGPAVQDYLSALCPDSVAALA